MPHLAIDLDRTGMLAGALHAQRAVARDAADRVAWASRLAELSIPSVALLDDLAHQLGAVGKLLQQAEHTARSFVLPPLAQMPPTTPWNQVRQLASHNTFELDGGVGAASTRGFRSFELDLHTGSPQPFGVPGIMGPSDEAAGEWFVYHHSLDPDSAHDRLSTALEAVAAETGAEPITLFLDLKDPLVGEHGPAVLDRALDDHLGERLFTPRDLLARSPEEATLVGSVGVAGWPSVDELSGRVLVVLTAEVAAYLRRPIEEASAFVALPPNRWTMQHPEIIFFNERGSRLSAIELEAIEARASVVRAWGPVVGDALDANYVAID